MQTYSAFAFMCPYTPGQRDETVLIDATEAIIRRPLTAAEKIVVRRLDDYSLRVTPWPLQT